MKRMSRYAMPCRLVGLLLCALLLAGILPCFGALGAQKKNSAGSLKVSLSTDITAIPAETRNIKFTLFKVGTPAQDTAIGWRFDNDNGLSRYTNGIVEMVKAERNSELQRAVNQLADVITGDYKLMDKCRVETLDLSSGSAKAQKLDQGIYIGVLTDAPAGLSANTSLFTIPFWNADKTELLYDADIVVKDVYNKDSVTVNKVDSEDRTPIQGAMFTLYYDNRPIATYISDKEGRFTISTDDPALANLLPKSDAERVVMVLKETNAPRGYILPRNDAYKVVLARKTTHLVEDDVIQKPISIYEITIGNGQKELTVPNYPEYEFENIYKSVTVNKVSNTNSPLTGAEFTLYYDNRAITTYSGGRFTISTEDKPLQRYLPSPGKKITMKLRETRAPSGYQRSTTDYDVVISAILVKAWNEQHTKLINAVTYYITVDGEQTLSVVNEPEETEPEPPAGGGGGGGVPQEPTPTTDITVTKNWVDDGNFNQVRPGAIDITLYADGSPVDAQPTWTRSGDSWTATFTNLPTVDGSGKEISYTVDESPVEYYKKQVSGLTITNTLEDRPPQEYVDLSVTKIWQDNGNIEGRRPTNITIHLYRDGTLIETVHVTAGTDWLYTFKHLPADNGFGHVYEYTIDEDTVPGYYKRINGTEITNGMLPPDGDIPNVPDQPKEIPERGGTPAPVFEDLTDEELEELFDMFGYGTPLYGMLGTGDQVPVWVWVCGSVGIIALAMAVLMGRKKRKQQ